MFALFGSSWEVLAAIGFIAALATLSGGLLALALKDKIHLILGFSAGAVVAVALLELLPEALKAAGGSKDQSLTTAYAALGFMAYLIADQGIGVLTGPVSTLRAQISAASLTVHSILDGLAIGIAFQASEATGFVLAAAVMAHDFSDGVNTVNLSLIGSNPSIARRWLLADALAPLLGLSLASALRPPDSAFAPLLAIFAGAFLYIGAGKLIGESHRRHPHLWTTLTSVIGFGAIALTVAWFAHV